MTPAISAALAKEILARSSILRHAVLIQALLNNTCPLEGITAFEWARVFFKGSIAGAHRLDEMGLTWEALVQIAIARTHEENNDAH